MKLTWLLMATLVFGASFASASSVDACKFDKHTLKKIQQIPEKNRLPLMDAYGEMVGSIEYIPGSNELLNMFLCGDNPNYYYVTATAEEWIGQVGKTKIVDMIYNDEYNVGVQATTHFIGNKRAKVELTIDVEFGGEPEHADYAPFTASFYVDLPVK